MKSRILLILVGIASTFLVTSCACPVPASKPLEESKAPSEAELEAARHAQAIAQLKFWMRAFEAYTQPVHCDTTFAEPKDTEDLLRQVATDKNNRDPWGGLWALRRVYYFESGRGKDIGKGVCSAGPDGIFNTEDDIRGIRTRWGKWSPASSALLDE